MKRKILTLSFIALLIVVGAVGYWIISGRMFTKNGPAIADKHDHHDHEQGKALYTCPMHPTVIQDHPGDCPICGMKLEKKLERPDTATVASEDIKTVQLSSEMIQMLGVRSEEVKSQRLIKEIRASGQLDYNEKQIKTISARVPGRIDKLFVDYTGVRVKSGDPLALLYSPELISAQREYLLAFETLEKVKESSIHEAHQHAQNLLDASRQRLILWGVNSQQLKEIESQKNVPLHFTVYSPMSGTVIQKNVVEGMYVNEGSPLYTIVDLSNVWLYADIYEYELPWVKSGQRVEVGLVAYPDKKFRGEVDFIDPVLNPNTRTVRVRAEIKNRDSLLKPGMFADAFLQAVVGEDVVAVPESSVIHSGERKVVILDRKDGKFTPEEVVIGALAKGYYQILSGVSPGDWVVTSANFLIDSESNLRTAVAKMAEYSR